MRWNLKQVKHGTTWKTTFAFFPVFLEDAQEYAWLEKVKKRTTYNVFNDRVVDYFSLEY